MSYANANTNRNVKSNWLDDEQLAGVSNCSSQPLAAGKRRLRMSLSRRPLLLFDDDDDDYDDDVGTPAGHSGKRASRREFWSWSVKVYGTQNQKYIPL